MRYHQIVQYIKRNFKLFMILVVVAYIVIVQIYQIVTSSVPLPNEHNIQADVQLGLRIDEIDRTEIDSVSLEFWENYYTFKTNLPLVTISLEYIYISPRFISRNNIKSICFQNIEAKNIDVEIEIQDIEKLITNPKCVEAEMNYIPSKDFAVLIYNPYKTGFWSPYFYPFDTRSINFDLATKLVFLNDENNEVDVESFPVVRAIGRPQNSGESRLILYNNDEAAPSNTTIVVKRFIIYQALIVFVVILVILVIVHLRKISKRANFWEVAAGIFLGLWGMHEVLIPVHITSVTLVSSIFLALYLLLVIFIVYETVTKKWDDNEKLVGKDR